MFAIKDKYNNYDTHPFLSSLYFTFFSGIVSFVFDSIFLSLFAGICYLIHASMKDSSEWQYTSVYLFSINNARVWFAYSQFWFNYTIVGVCLFVLLRLRDSIYFIINVLIKQPYILKDSFSHSRDHRFHHYIKNTSKFFIFCFFGIRIYQHKLRYRSTISKMFELLFGRYLWFSIYVATVFCFVEEVILHNSSEIWFTTTTTWPKEVQDTGCTATKIISASSELFFEFTNNQIVIDALLFLDGVYLNFLKYRADIRFFLVFAFPVFQELCLGGLFDMSFNKDYIAQTCAFVFVVVSLITPFIMFHSSHKILDNVWLWLVTLMSLGLFAVSTLLLNDFPLTFAYLILKGTTWSRSYTDFGITVISLIAIMAFTSTMLLIIRPYYYANDKYIETNRDGISLLKIIFDYIAQEFVQVFSSLSGFILSETLIFAILAIFLAWHTADLGFPITRISFTKSLAPVLPSYTDLNYIEESLKDFTTIQDLTLNLVLNTTQRTIDSYNRMLSKIPCINIGITDICIGSILGEISKVIENIQLEVQKDVLEFILEIVTKTLEAILNVSIDELQRDIAKLVHIVQKYTVGLFDFLDFSFITKEDIPWWFTYLPLFSMFFVIGFNFVGLLFPEVASGFQTYIIVGLFHGVLGFVVILLGSRRLLENFGYTANITYTDTIYWDAATLIIIPVSIAQLVTYTPDNLLKHAECQYMVTQFILDSDDEPQNISRQSSTEQIPLIIGHFKKKDRHNKKLKTVKL